MNKEYVIRTIEDLALIPSEHWDAVLRDLRQWMEMRSEAQPLIDAGLLELKEARWIDDGIEGVSELGVYGADGQHLATVKLQEGA